MTVRETQKRSGWWSFAEEKIYLRILSWVRPPSYTAQGVMFCSSYRVNPLFRCVAMGPMARQGTRRNMALV